ncbi:MAG: hypothetical protein OXU74_15060 [Gemmatimonadota bacterium]|nr:hypothetical protein [Gemmatimonadota bacterium]
MTRSIGLGAVILLTGCSTAPVSFHGVAPPGKDDAYECAVAQLNILGYTIEDGNKDTGFVRGRKQTSGLGTQLLTGNAYHDILTATAFDNPGTGETNLRVVASRVADHDISILGGLSDEQPAEGVETIAPSDSGKADARVLLAGCGVNNVVGPSQDQEQFVLEGVV